MLTFLFDLDGTLVITDEIYFQVWKTILEEYNIVLTEEIFTTYIQGNNDQSVINSLLGNLHIDKYQLSVTKDTLFIQNMEKLRIIDGVYSFLQKVHEAGYKCGIVTNCNRNVATKIIDKLEIGELVDLVITANDCTQGKPNPEPYLLAITRLNTTHDQCIIFEDSKSGILSAQSVNPKLLIGVETIYDKTELRNHNVQYSITNYVGLDISTVLKYSISAYEDISKKLLYSLNNENISEIIIDPVKLKGGFIADVIQFKTSMKDGSFEHHVLKYENTESNNLSKMAKQLELYQREYYFYKIISPHVPIKIPKMRAMFQGNDFIDCGIILEDLLERGFTINLNLNTENIDISLKIVHRMAKMHSKFWNTDLKKRFPELKNTIDPCFCPFIGDFIREKYELFQQKWWKNMNPLQFRKCNEIIANFGNIQKRFSSGNHITFIHGDIKSPNIFYDVQNGHEPYFLDWQHCAMGKGVQDVIFFIIESFDLKQIPIVFGIIKHYYYKKLIEYGVNNYSWKEYEDDLVDAICYVPFFTSIWFGTTPQDELIDKNFPFFFINKMLFLLEHTSVEDTVKNM
jgi:beta-phosphoglucomutase